MQSKNSHTIISQLTLSKNDLNKINTNGNERQVSYDKVSYNKHLTSA